MNELVEFIRLIKKVMIRIEILEYILITKNVIGENEVKELYKKYNVEEDIENMLKGEEYE